MNRFMSASLFFFMYFRFGDLFNFNLRRVIQTQCQFISMDSQFHRVAHRRKLDACHIGTRYHAHIEEMLAEGTFSPDTQDSRIFGRLQFFQIHKYLFD